MWRVVQEQRADLAELIGTLTAEQWKHPTLCRGWTMREIAAHLSYGSRARLGSVLFQVVRARGNFDRFVDIVTRQDAARPVKDLLADLQAAAVSRRLAPGQSLTNAMLDALVHGQDIAIPLGIERSMPLEAARVCADDVWRRAFPFRARRRLHGYRLVATDTPWSVGEGAQIEGPIAALLLLITGRSAALDHLTGDYDPARIHVSP